MRVATAFVCAIAVGLLTAPLGPGGAVAQDTAQVQALTQAYNASGQALFQGFTGSPGNIVLSPYSIGTAMAMALSGARGATETQMAAVLKHRLARPEINAANSDPLAILNAYDRSATLRLALRTRAWTVRDARPGSWRTASVGLRCGARAISAWGLRHCRRRPSFWPRTR